MAVVNIQVSFTTLNERPLYETSSAWHGMTYMMAFGYDIEISTILEYLDLFLQLKFFTTANNIVPIFPLARFLA